MSTIFAEALPYIDSDNYPVWAVGFVVTVAQKLPAFFFCCSSGVGNLYVFPCISRVACWTVSVFTHVVYFFKKYQKYLELVEYFSYLNTVISPANTYVLSMV